MVDVVLIIGAAAFGLFMLIPTAAMHSRLALIIDLILGIAACGALVARRRLPAQVGAFAVAASAVSAFAAGASLVALFNAAIRVRTAILIALTAGELVATFCFPLLYPGAADFSYTAQVTIGGLLNLAVVGWGLMVRAQRNYLRTVEGRARDLATGRELLAANVRDQERRRIAREMHDALAHRLSLLSVHAGALELRPDLSPEQIRTMAGVIRGTSHHALEDLQEVIGLLRDSASHNTSLLNPHPGLDDLPELVTEARRAGSRVELVQEVSEDRTNTRNHAAATSVYRIVQEGLTNARKHAPSSPVKVVVQTDDPGEVMVTVSTFLRSHPATSRPIPGTGTGLRGLAERVSLVGGTFTTTTVGNQFVITGRLPWSL
ncbi:histidine kinase [Nocardioidaceae bacterium SCSIO 66511]|nr:histidine kinase [Nocardioidaceae bacterium SCSIO 66511]